jgi:hypothetical protein
MAICSNVLFLIDESESVGATAYEASIDWVSDLITDWVPSDSKVAVVAFSKDNDVVYTFDQDQTRSVIINTLQQELTDYAKQSTDTYSAIKAAVQMFEDNGDRSGNLLFIITDGKPKCWSSDLDCKQDLCESETNQELEAALSEYNIDVVVLGVTDAFESSALECIEQVSTIITIADYTPESLEAATTNVQELSCPSNPDRCSGSDVYHIQFLFDESGSVGGDAFRETITFVKNMISRHINSQSVLSAMAFGQDNDPVWHFSDDQSSRSGILAALDEESNDFAGSSTDTYNVVKSGAAEFAFEGYTENNIMILLTDGNPKCRSADVDCIEDICGADSDLVDLLRTNNIEVILIGVGSKIDLSQIDCLVNDVSTNVVHYIDDYDQTLFDELALKIRKKTCTYDSTDGASSANAEPQSLTFLHRISSNQWTNESVITACAIAFLFAFVCMSLCICGSYCYCTVRTKKYAKVQFDADSEEDAVEEEQQLQA